MIDTSIYPKEVTHLLDRAVSRNFILGHDFLTNSKYITATYKDGRIYILGGYDLSDLDWILYIQPLFGSSTITHNLDDYLFYEDPYVDQVFSLEEDLID